MFGEDERAWVEREHHSSGVDSKALMPMKSAQQQSSARPSTALPSTINIQSLRYCLRQHRFRIYCCRRSEALSVIVHFGRADFYRVTVMNCKVNQSPVPDGIDCLRAICLSFGQFGRLAVVRNHLPKFFRNHTIRDVRPSSSTRRRMGILNTPDFLIFAEIMTCR